MKRMLENLTNEETSTFPELEFFGQMHGTYLFAQGQGGLFTSLTSMLPKNVSSMSTIAKRLVRLTAVYSSFWFPYLFEFSGSDYISLQEKNVPS